MGGDRPNSKWTNLKNSAKAFMNKLATDEKMRKAVKVSAIAYDDISEIIFETQEPSVQLIDKIAFYGGGTRFDKPMQHAL